MTGDWATAIKLGLSLLVQLLSQLHPPLVRAVDVPGDPLNEDLLLLHGSQGSQNAWCELGEPNRVGSVMSFKDLAWWQQLLKALCTPSRPAAPSAPPLSASPSPGPRFGPKSWPVGSWGADPSCRGLGLDWDEEVTGCPWVPWWES